MISSNWSVYDNSSIIFQNNDAQEGGYIALANTTNFDIFGNASIIFNENKVNSNSFGLVFGYKFHESLFVEDSQLLFTRNNCSNLSFIINFDYMSLQNSKIIFNRNRISSGSIGFNIN